MRACAPLHFVPPRRASARAWPPVAARILGACQWVSWTSGAGCITGSGHDGPREGRNRAEGEQIGRASCRERVEIAGGGGAGKKKREKIETAGARSSGVRDIGGSGQASR